MLIARWLTRLIVYGLLAITILDGCTTINIINDRLSKLMYVDSAFDEHVSSFLNEAKMRHVVVDISRLTMIFGTTNTEDEPGTVGTCAEMNGMPVVTIDKKYWDISSDLEREELIFHELGHCLLSREHCEVRSNGASVSMMEPNMSGPAHYNANRKKLIDELFNPDEGCPKIGGPREV